MEDMLISCFVDFDELWNKKFLLIEFSYKNNYQASLGMAMKLYREGSTDRRFNSLKPGKLILIKQTSRGGTTEVVKMIQQIFKIA